MYIHLIDKDLQRYFIETEIVSEFAPDFVTVIVTPPTVTESPCCSVASRNSGLVEPGRRIVT
jgi:hypothetical protein